MVITSTAMGPGSGQVNNRWPAHWGIYFSPSQEADGNFNTLTSDLSLESSFLLPPLQRAKTQFQAS